MESHDDFLKAARAATGLNDFGEESFLDGLKVLTHAMKAEAGLNSAGAGFLQRMIVGHLIQRLNVEDWYRRHPEIDETQIIKPLFGVSLPRTSSTALSFMLAQDPNTRSLRLWEAMQPCPPPSTGEGVEARIAQAEAMGRMTAGTAPHFPSAATGPTECLALMALDFKSTTFTAVASIPSYVGWLATADLTSTYRYERRVLKLLQWGSPAKPWRLKSPAHLPYLDHLIKVFPDARFVMTHRDPADVIVSIVHLFADTRRAGSQTVDVKALAGSFVFALALSMKRALAFRDAGHNALFYDIDYRAMQRDPVTQVRGLYAWLGEPMTPEFEGGMTKWWKDNAEKREPNVHPDPATYGLDINQVRGMFAEYTARMPQWIKESASR